MNSTDDSKTWDKQFKFSELLPDFATWQSWRMETSRGFARVHTFDRWAYGPHQRQWVEITKAGGLGSGIVPVFFHGGYWRALGAEDHRCVLSGLGRLGEVCANVEYRLMPDYRMDDLVADAIAAVDILAGNLSEESRFLLVGHSAGAHLASSASLHGGFADKIAGIVAVSGIYDLVPVSKSFLQAEIHLSETEISTHSLIDTGLNTPLLCVVGGNETDEFQRQAHQMADANDAHCLVVQGAHHMSILKDLHSQGSALVEAMGHWLNGVGLPKEVDTVSS